MTQEEENAKPSNLKAFIPQASSVTPALEAATNS